MAERAGWHSIACSPIKRGGRLYGVLFAISRDQFEFDEVELRLLEGMADIAGLALASAARTHELLAHGERLEGLERAKTEFLQLASHELRGPITLVRGYLSMMDEGLLDADAVRRVAPMLTARLDGMSRVIEQMLDVARLEDPDAELERSPADLRDLVEDAMAIVRPMATERHRILLETPRSPVVVDVDRSRIQTALANLLMNAIKYSPDGGEVRCRMARGNRTVVVQVEDQGFGIAETDLPRLFTRFGRLRSAGQDIPGTGLGLYLTREIVRRHGGDVAVRSVVGVGSTFTLTLPESL